MEDYNLHLDFDLNPFGWLFALPDLNGDGDFSRELKRCGFIVDRYDTGRTPEENLRKKFEENEHSTPARRPLRACFNGGAQGAPENYVAHARPFPFFRKTVSASGK